MTLISLHVVDSLCVVVAASVIYRLLSRGPRRTYPPGPKGLPVIGNLFDMPKEYESEAYSEMGRVHHSDMVHLEVFGKHIVVLNSRQKALSLLEDRSQIYSDRPKLFVAGQLAMFDRTLVLSAFGPQHRAHRKNFHKMIGTKSHVEQYAAMQEREANKFLVRTLEKPEDLEQNIVFVTAGIILSIAYDYTPENMDDPLIRLSEDTIKLFSQLSSPGAYLADTFPTLAKVPSWVPGAGWKRDIPKWQELMTEFISRPLDFVKESMASGGTPRLVSNLLKGGLDADEAELLQWSIASLYSAGSETSFASIHWFCRAMMENPAVQRRAQAEIDDVVGRERIPGFSDREKLPYIQAVIKEVLRWGVVGPLAVPHRLMVDDIVDGYLLPEGTLVIANCRHFLTDPDVYSNPESFNPDRFLGPNPEDDPYSVVFGFGRRICPGNILADTTLYIMIVKILSVLTLSKPIDPKTGREIDAPTKLGGVGSIVKRSASFKCNIRLRYQSAVDLIHHGI